MRHKLAEGKTSTRRRLTTYKLPRPSLCMAIKLEFRHYLRDMQGKRSNPML